MIAGAVTREVANGQVIRVSVGAGLYELSITVIPKKEKPKPKPAPQPKSEPKEPSNLSPFKPKTNDGNSGGGSKDNNNDSNVKSNDNEKITSKLHSKKKNIKNSNTDKGKEKLTITKLRDKGVAVKKATDEYYVFYEDENGNEVKQKISKKEDEKLMEEGETAVEVVNKKRF